MITYKAHGLVMGNCWGGGICGYQAESLKSNSLKELEQQIESGIKDGSLDSGMGYESLIGAAMTIETVETRIIDGKRFVSTESKLKFFGNLSEGQAEMLSKVFYG